MWTLSPILKEILQMIVIKPSQHFTYEKTKAWDLIDWMQSYSQDMEMLRFSVVQSDYRSPVPFSKGTECQNSSHADTQDWALRFQGAPGLKRRWQGKELPQFVTTLFCLWGGESVLGKWSGECGASRRPSQSSDPIPGLSDVCL